MIRWSLNDAFLHTIRSTLQQQLNALLCVCVRACVCVLNTLLGRPLLDDGPSAINLFIHAFKNNVEIGIEKMNHLLKKITLNKK